MVFSMTIIYQFSRIISIHYSIRNQHLKVTKVPGLIKSSERLLIFHFANCVENMETHYN